MERIKRIDLEYRFIHLYPLNQLEKKDLFHLFS